MRHVRISWLVALALLIAGAIWSNSAAAHEHNDLQPAQAQAANPQNASAEAHERMEAHHHEEDARPSTFPGRLLAWLGHMHPFAVHFPIVLFPVSWLALVFARRRGDKVDLIRAFIVVAGVAAIAAATLGWLGAGFALADTDPIRTAHRWTGTFLALVGAVAAVWAWRRAGAVNSRAMVWLLGLATLILLAQGWMGAVLTHGMEHIQF
jgi:hypothetical protein